MASRKDQVQAYFFLVGRLFAALTHGKPDILDPPSRRLSAGVVLGILVGVLLVAIFWIVGLMSPAAATSSSWQQPGSIIVDSNTGARYLYLGGQLRPVLNYSSAMLAVAAGSSNSSGSAAPPAVVDVSSRSLTGVAVGTPIGIPGAPDAIPAATGLDTAPWTICVSPPDASTTPTVTLRVGSPAGSMLTADQGLLVATSDGTKYILWQGHRYRIDDPTAGFALGLNSTVPVPVPMNWLSAVPAARDITVPKVGAIGSAGPAMDGQPSKVGQIYRVTNPALNSSQVFVVTSSGLAPLDPTAEALLLAAPATQAAYPNQPVEPLSVTERALVGVPTSTEADLRGYPSPLPKMINGTLSDARLPCMSFGLGGNGGGTLLTMPAATVASLSVPTGQHVAGTIVDNVSIPAGGAVLARDLPAAGAAADTEYLITDFGVKFPLANSTVAGALGYSTSSPVSVPNPLLALLPTGPVLSESAALAQQAPGAS